MLGSISEKAIEASREKLWKLASDIWACPEGAYQEKNACQWMAEAMKAEGFEVEIGVAGVPTALKATWGSGKPVLGLLAEYDALPGLSNDLSSTPNPVEGQAYGHACGHNLLGVTNVAAAIGLKAEMEANGLPGTIVFYGCPAEEVLTGKVFMARGGAFDDLDFAIAFHPGSANRVSGGVMTGLNSFELHFTGRSSHAGGAPHQGRSALDAVELTNIGINYLREHVPTEVRMHYSYIEAGTAPNIVPAKASAWYYVRALRRETINDVYERILRIAKGAAMMTDTEVEVKFLGGCYPTMPNHTLVELVNDCMGAIPQEPWTEEEVAFARNINETVEESYKAMVKNMGLEEGTQLFTGIAPISTANGFGSTDVGDVNHLAPGAFFTTACQPLAAPGHSWQVTSASGSSIGEKGMIYAGKVLALSYLRLITEPELAAKATEEFKAAMKGREYICPIPDDVAVPGTEG